MSAVSIIALVFWAFSVKAAPTVATCSTTFTPVTASAAFKALDPGWNVGNTLDAVPNEGSWNNAPVQASTFAKIKEKGFKSIRIPVTWGYHFSDASPTWTVDKTFMDRVETVVDQVLALDLYAILNVHHDSWVWADPTVANANYTMIEEKFSRLWDQIGARFACKSSKLIFEAINEPSGNTQEHATLLNKLNDDFLRSINNAGGYNPQRVVSLSGLGQDMVKTSQWFIRGTSYPKQPWGLQFHYYSPYDFIFQAWGKTIWGSEADKASMAQDFAYFNGNFSSIPTFIGEWSAAPANTEAAARWKYTDAFIRLCKKYGYSQVLWDNGADQFQRNTGKFNDPTQMGILFSAVQGKTNTLADSTTDPALTSQNTSAILFHKYGDAVTSASVPYLLNGNTLSSIKNSGKTLSNGEDYTFSSSGVLTLSQAYLSTLYTPTTAPGNLATLALTFSSGAPLTLNVTQYSTPTVAQKTFALSQINLNSEFYVPINYAGLRQIASIKAVLADGRYLADDWTQWLPPLQQARWTMGDWEWKDEGLKLNPSGLAKLKAAGISVTLTLEFFPRLPGNTVDVTFTQ